LYDCCTDITQYCIHGRNGGNGLEAGGLEYSHERMYIHIVIFIENVTNYCNLLNPKDNISLPISVHVNQNGNRSIVFHLLGLTVEVNYIFSTNCYSTVRPMFRVPKIRNQIYFSLLL